MDENIVSLTQLWAKSLKAQWVIAHCYYVAPVLTKYKNRLLSMHREGLNIFTKKHRIPDGHCALLKVDLRMHFHYIFIKIKLIF